jgi:hypothetical protein
MILTLARPIQHQSFIARPAPRRIKPSCIICGIAQTRRPIRVTADMHHLAQAQLQPHKPEAHVTHSPCWSGSVRGSPRRFERFCMSCLIRFHLRPVPALCQLLVTLAPDVEYLTKILCFWFPSTLSLFPTTHCSI